ncbi:RNA polymerase sigma-70 factor [Sphingobacterium sp. Mn56C]|uniref:RNA polymerase sigma-70 factor n=1 Tax=Sphingobacterium sp. Mn56C TaxID=3395261 RepID=UPI003BE2209B
MEKSDKERLEAVVANDIAAFEQLYKLYYKRLYILAFKYMNDESVAEEIVNDVFMKLWKDAGQLTIQQSLSGYLSRCVINRALTLLKNQKLQAAQQTSYWQAGVDAEDADAVDIAALLEKKLLHLEMAIESLPAQCKKVLIMSKFEKRKQQAIADNLGISIKTVKNHLSLSYAKIRVYFEEHKLISVFFAFLHFAIGTFWMFRNH